MQERAEELVRLEVDGQRDGRFLATPGGMRLAAG
jgi:hypothetical protein